MRFRAVTALLVLIAIAVMATSATAFNGERKGFILGFGAGVSWSSFKGEVEGFDLGDTETKFGIGTDFKIGAGINDQLLIYYVNRVAWLKSDNFTSNGDLLEDITIASSVGLVGISYYFKTEAPAWYVVGAIGVSTWSAPLESNSEMFTGFGVTGGVGYEFTPHWSLEATVNWGKPTKTIIGYDVEITAISVLVTFMGLAF